MLRRDREARYCAAVSRKEYDHELVTGILQTLLNTHGEAAIHGFVDMIADDEQQLDILRQRLRRRKGR